MWVDGKQVATKTISGKIKYHPSDANMYIGTYKASDEQYNLVGEIYSAFIYNHAISDADIVRR